MIIIFVLLICMKKVPSSCANQYVILAMDQFASAPHCLASFRWILFSLPFQFLWPTNSTVISLISSSSRKQQKTMMKKHSSVSTIWFICVRLEDALKTLLHHLFHSNIVKRACLNLLTIFSGIEWQKSGHHLRLSPLVFSTNADSA